MMRMIVQLLLSAVAVNIAAWLVPGIHLDGFGAALGVALLLAVLNTFLKPVLVFFSLPITLLTFGLFLWVINTVMVMVCDTFIKGFEVESFLWGMLFSAILTLVSSFLEAANE